MGRFYYGDIEGKFWFGIQSSNDPEFFGLEEEKNEINYYTEDIEKVEEGVNKCLKELKGYKEIIEDYFNDKEGYNEQKMAEELEISNEKLREKLVWFARLELGEKILNYLKEEGNCSLTAEL